MGGGGAVPRNICCWRSMSARCKTCRASPMHPSSASTIACTQQRSSTSPTRRCCDAATSCAATQHAVRWTRPSGASAIAGAQRHALAMPTSTVYPAVHWLPLEREESRRRCGRSPGADVAGVPAQMWQESRRRCGRSPGADVAGVPGADALPAVTTAHAKMTAAEYLHVCVRAVVLLPPKVEVCLEHLPPPQPHPMRARTQAHSGRALT